MEDSIRKKSEYKDLNEEQGGIRRRLRDRDLLRKRKAEAEEKETNQEESPRKRRAEDSSGAKRRGRPRKVEAAREISGAQEEAAAAAAAPVAAAVVVSEPAQTYPDHTFFTLSAVESQPPSATAVPLQVFGSALSFIPAPASTDPAPEEGPVPVPVQEQTPASPPDVPALIQAPEPGAADLGADVAPSSAPSETTGQDTGGQVTIEDLGPDVEEDLALSQTKVSDEDLNGTTSVDITEQSDAPTAPSFSSLAPSQEYLPGNLL